MGFGAILNFRVDFHNYGIDRSVNVVNQVDYANAATFVVIFSFLENFDIRETIKTVSPMRRFFMDSNKKKLMLQITSAAERALMAFLLSDDKGLKKWLTVARDTINNVLESLA